MSPILVCLCILGEKEMLDVGVSGKLLEEHIRLRRLSTEAKNIIPEMFFKSTFGRNNHANMTKEKEPKTTRIREVLIRLH